MLSENYVLKEASTRPMVEPLILFPVLSITNDRCQLTINKIMTCGFTGTAPTCTWPAFGITAIISGAAIG